MKVGFTGTRYGCTAPQAAALRSVLVSLKISEGHHGDCVGADAEFHEILNERVPLIIHPPADSTHRAWCDSPHILPSKTHFARNRDIVQAVDLMVACPPAEEWLNRGGTYYTMDYALKQRKNLIVIWPSGKRTKHEFSDGGCVVTLPNG